jgi:hypothetical protein
VRELRGFAELFDLDRKILQENLYGVDLNEEAAHVAKLSLWIKTAVPGKIRTSLDHNVRVGNSIVADKSIDAKAFEWKAEFPEVFYPERGAGGGTTFSQSAPIGPAFPLRPIGRQKVNSTGRHRDLTTGDLPG